MELTEKTVLLIQEAIDLYIIKLNKDLNEIENKKPNNSEYVRSNIRLLQNTANFLEDQKRASKDNTAPDSKLREAVDDIELYILSIWENHKDPKSWHFDICSLDQFINNSCKYFTEYKEPYYYTPIFKGSRIMCEIKIDEIRKAIKEAGNTEELKETIRALCHIN